MTPLLPLVLVALFAQAKDDGCPFDWQRLEPMSTFRYPNTVCVIPATGVVVTLDLSAFCWPDDRLCVERKP